MLKKCCGFTVMEVLIVVAIIGILVAVSIPIFASHLDEARQSTCESKRSALALVISTASLTDKVPVSNDLFEEIYLPNKAQYACPKGGEFTWEDPASGQMMGTIVCSVHGYMPGGGGPGGGDPGGGDPGGGDPGGGTYVGQDGNTENPIDTELPVGDSTVWPQPEDYPPNGEVQMSPGGIFRHTDGYYYVIYESDTIWKGNVDLGPGALKDQGFVVQLTGRIVTYNGNEIKYDPAIKRGDLCLENGIYYVYKHYGGNIKRPGLQPDVWYKIPK
ncbi:MAG: prepilin-type N-terminal cleavage/methylation domain-containing protein [Eubacteriales bacterium]|nr:prepilin-type N-terminal cleavage/methylation domain-containing protein [Eubacteriales bacterium]MDD4389855.1 prepilin-type N-terminal cleavage/methylation domain-containing protein [Eubacteriales bacterium]